jgi:apolipoprotein N-acyltransferase
MADDRTTPERPSAEPEIIPPDRNQRRSPWQSYGYAQQHGARRIYVARLGPFGFALLMLALSALVAVILIFVLGAVLIWIPILALLAVGAAIFGRFRR